MKNEKSKLKIKKRSVELFDNIKIHSDYDYFYMNNPDYFLTFTDGINENQVSNGIDSVENIIILSKNYNEENDFESSLEQFAKEKKLKINYNHYSSHNSYIAQEYPIGSNDNSKYDEEYDINYFIESSDNLAIINFTDTNLNLINLTDNLQITKVKEGSSSGKFDLNQIIYINKNLNLANLIRLYKRAIEIKMKYFEYLKLPEHIQDAINNNTSIILACNPPIGFKKGKKQNLVKLLNSTENKELAENVAGSKKLLEIEKELVKTMIKSCNNSLKSLNLSFGILDYILSEGITIDSLVDAGMELCVGIEETPEKITELKTKLKQQILKSLEDLNVVALLMSAMRCEEDFQSNRLREVDVSDDPAYLYTDEVLGIAIANQIAGTKAMFNFKRYDEEKPGVISELGPMVDDIFAGLIAGCMSKIFEDDY